MVTLRTSILMVLALAVAASAALPKLKNEGGPPFLSGYSTTMDSDLKVTLVCALVANSYSCASASANGTLSTELATYTSWECGSEPGTYLAVATTKTIAEDGTEKDSELCEYGTWDFGTGVNKWATSETECPTKTTDVSKYIEAFGGDNTC